MVLEDKTEATIPESRQLRISETERIDAVYRSYPFLNDDEFVAENLNRWLS